VDCNAHGVRFGTGRCSWVGRCGGVGARRAGRDAARKRKRRGLAAPPSGRRCV